MTTIRVARRKRFTTIDRAAINDTRLSFRARGVLAWLLDKPDNWKTNAEAISKSGKEGRDAIRAALAELQDCGYLKRPVWREQGKWQTEWTVFERPGLTELFDDEDESPSLETRCGEPATENQRWLTDAENQASSTEDGELNTDLGLEPLSAVERTEPEPPIPPPFRESGLSLADWILEQQNAGSA